MKSKKYNLIPVALLLTYCPWLLVFNSSKEYDLTYEGTKVCLCVVSLSSGSVGGFFFFLVYSYLHIDGLILLMQNFAYYKGRNVVKILHQ